MIYVIGDTHGEMEHHKLSNSVVKSACNGVFPDYVIVLGDFGFIWDNNPDTSLERYWLKWLEEKPWITLFIDGNHENHVRLNKLPTVSMFESDVGQISDKIFHLRRGRVYTIENKTFFCMGGAESIDKAQRKAYVSWWPEEVPSFADYKRAKANLAKHDFEVDYVLTHTCPSSIFKEMYPEVWNMEETHDPTGDMLESFKSLTQHKAWYFGHLHEDRLKLVNNALYIASYEKGHLIH